MIIADANIENDLENSATYLRDELCFGNGSIKHRLTEGCSRTERDEQGCDEAGRDGDLTLEIPATG